jgi:transposase-like protein
MKLRFGEAVTCKKCGKTGKFHRIKRHPAYECAWCGFEIFPMVGTIFHKSHTPLQKWFYAMYLFTTTRHGVPAKELERQLGVSYPTAFRMAHLIRTYMAKVDGDSGLSGHVEVDETFVGGRRTGGGMRRTMENKTVVFGMLQRDGDVITRVVPGRHRDQLLPHVRQNIARGSKVSTDDHGAYRHLKLYGYDHKSVNHSADEWVNGETHTNAIEGFWSILKRSIKSTHVRVSKKHLAKYLGEFEFRYNMRKTPYLMFDRLLAAF